MAPDGAACAGAFERRTDEERALDRCGDDNGFAAYVKILL